MSRTFRRTHLTNTRNKIFLMNPMDRPNKGDWFYRDGLVWVGDSIVCSKRSARHDETVEAIVTYRRRVFHMDRASVFNPQMKVYYRRIVRHAQNRTLLDWEREDYPLRSSNNGLLWFLL